MDRPAMAPPTARVDPLGFPMGVAFYIVTEREFPESWVNGKALPRHAERLDARCRELGMRPLTSFFSHSPAEAAAFLASEGADPATVNLPPEQWFDAAEGLAVVRTLLRDPERLPGKKGAAAEDLREFEALLVRLDDEKVRWHLAVDF